MRPRARSLAPQVLAIGGHGGSVGLFSAGNYLGSLPLDSLKPADMDEVTVARFSKDSKLLHTGSRSSVIYTWDLKQQVGHARMRAHARGRAHRAPDSSAAVAAGPEPAPHWQAPLPRCTG